MRQSKTSLWLILGIGALSLACSGAKDLSTRQQPRPDDGVAAPAVAEPAAAAAETLSPQELLELRAAVLRAEDRREVDAALRDAASHSDPRAKAAALRALGRIGSPDALDLLLDAVGDASPEVRAEVAYALGLLRDPGGLQALEILSRDAEPAVRARAADGLGFLMDPATNETLATLIGDDDLRVSSAAAYAVTRFARADFAVDALTRAVESRSEADGMPALHALALLAARPLALGPQARLEVRDRFVRLARSRSPAVRLMAAVGLRVPSSESEGDAVAALSTDELAEIRIQAVLDLGFPGAPLEPVITRALDDPDDRVGLAAVAAMSRMEGVQPWEMLSDVIVWDERLWLRRQAAHTLAEVAPDLAAGVARGLSKAEESVLRAASATLIYGRDDASSQEIAQRLFDDPYPRVRLAAIPAMAGIPGPLSVNLAEVWDHADPAMRTAVAEAAGYLLADEDRAEADREDAMTLLAKLWSLEDDTARSRVQIAILDAAAQAGADPATRALMESGLDSPRYEVRLRAIDHLDQLFGEDRSAEAGPAADRPLEDYVRILEWAADPRAVLVTVERPGFLPDAFTMKLDVENAPLTAWSFSQLAGEGFYDGQAIHRVVPNFVVQTGDPAGDGSGGPGYAIRDEIGPSSFAPGTLGMASAGRDLAGSQWFFTLTPQPQLNGRYTAFGRVVQNFPGVAALLLPGDRVVSVQVYTGDGSERVPAVDEL